MGGSDQWGNIVAGIDLIRRTISKQAFGITFPLITTSSGIKMGKTHKGAVWLDPERFSPYDYYQFWVNTDDADVVRFLSLFTFLPMDQIEKIKTLSGADLNKAKAVLAFEATKIAHGEEEALKALKASVSVFGSIDISAELLKDSSIPRGTQKVVNDESVPSTVYEKESILNIVPVVDLYVETGLCKSKSDARRLIKQGGAYINGDRVSAFDHTLSDSEIQNDEILLRAGKKKYHKIIFG